MIVSTAEVATPHSHKYRSLVSDALWARLVHRIADDEVVELETAERYMNETLGYLKFVSDKPDYSYSPSPAVDVGWHTFILYTRPYADFCQTLAGRYLHHEPSDNPGTEHSPERIAKTVAAMTSEGYDVDHSLWPLDSLPRC